MASPHRLFLPARRELVPLFAIAFGKTESRYEWVETNAAPTAPSLEERSRSRGSFHLALETTCKTSQGSTGFLHGTHFTGTQTSFDEGPALVIFLHIPAPRQAVLLRTRLDWRDRFKEHAHTRTYRRPAANSRCLLVRTSTRVTFTPYTPEPF